MSALRFAAALLAVGFALVLQVSLFPHVAWQGIVPNLCLLVVVGAALTRGAQFAAAVVVTVAASSFVGTSVFALSGLFLRDPVTDVVELLQVILVAVLWDVLLTPFVLPLVMTMFHRLEPERATV